MKHKLIIFIVLICLIISCKKNNCTQDVPEICQSIDLLPEYEPVCGCDGKTYHNSSVAYCSGVIEYTKGECK